MAGHLTIDEPDLDRVLLAALEQNRSSTCITTSDLEPPGPRIVYVNPAYCEMTGHEASAVLGRTPRLMQGPLTERAVLDRLKADLTAGRAFTGETVNYRKDGTPFYLARRIDPVRDGNGRITHFVATQEDVTRLRRAERRLAAEHRVDRSVGALLRDPDHAEPFASLATEAAAALGEVAALGTAAVEIHQRGGPPWRASTGPVPDELQAVLSTGADVGLVRHADGPSHWSRRQRGVDGVDVRLGVGLEPAEADLVDVEGLDGVAERIHAAVVAVAEYERQHHIALELQHALLPGDHLDAEGLEVAVRYRPGSKQALVGGDWYDVVAGPDHVTVVVGDVAGSGVGAAATMGRIRSKARLLLQEGAEPAAVLDRLDRVCAGEGWFVTMLVVGIEGHDLTVTSAGHPPPLLALPSGAASLVEVVPRPPLGIGVEAPDATTRTTVPPDTTTVLFTDGLVERRGERFDESLDRLLDVARAGPADPELLVDHLLDRLGPSTDDCALLAFKRGPGGTRISRVAP